MVVPGFNVRSVSHPALRAGRSTSLPCKPSTPPSQGLSSLHRSKKRLPCNHLNPCFIFLQPPVLLNAPKITSPRIQKPANALPPASTSRTRALRCNISRTSDGFPSQLHNQPALKTTPVGILISQFAKQSGHLIPRSYFAFMK